MLHLGATLLLAVLFLGTPAATYAQGDEAGSIRTMLEQRDQDVKQILGTSDSFTQAQREHLKTEINDVISFEAMSQQALGPFWSDLTADQRQSFVEVFSDIVRAQSLSDLDVYRSQVTYETVDVEGDSAYVKTTTIYKETPMPVEYIMGREDGTWFVHDIILDDVSTAEGYARSFQTVIRKKGFDALMNSLEKRRAKIETTS
jgi:phospholipid transport system substrate-binding protein